jgi:predicted GTPase
MTNYINLRDFEAKKRFVLSNIQNVIQLAIELQSTEISQHLNETKLQLEKDAFMLTVVGEFSRGKSTFINALLGSNVLPSKVKPTTAMINRIYYNDLPTYSLLYRSGNDAKKEISESEFRKLAAPREADIDDPEDLVRYDRELEFFRKISMAEIGYPNMFCKADIEIYDTPGTNDIDETREEITYSFVPKSDAVIFLLSATSPFADTEMDFLKERILNEHINKVFFVVNFKDRLKTIQDEEKVVSYIREKLSNLIQDPTIILVSSYDALTIRRLANNETFKIKSQVYKNIEDTGLPILESVLSSFLQNEKGQVKLAKPVNRLVEQINKLTSDTLSIRLATASMKIDEIVEKINELKPQLDRFKQNTREIINNLVIELKSEEDTLIREVDKQLRQMSDLLCQSLDHYDGSLEEQSINRFLKQRASSVQNKIQEDLNNVKKTIIENHVLNAYKQLNTEEKDLNKSVQQIFNLNLEMNYQFDISSIQNDDSDLVGIILGAAGIGFGAIILAPALLVLGGIGAALGALFFGGGNILNVISDYRRQQKIADIKRQLERSLYDNRFEIKQKFSDEWLSLIRKIEMSFEKEVHEKTLRLERDLHQVRLDKESEKRSVEEQHNYYKSLIGNLNSIKTDVFKVIS